jgi:transposase
MESVIGSCAGLDVHKKSGEACVRRIEPDGRLHMQTRSWGTTTGQLQQMAAWLAAQQVTHVAMESTGVFWKPIYNILEGRFEVLLVNAQHLKQVPGRKTDWSDCQWIAQLLPHGLLRGSFVPPREQRELRDLTRHRAQLTAERTRIANRIHKLLEDANIQLAAVASDVLGVSGRAMLEALIRGEADPDKLADLAQGQLRGKIPELREALEGHVTEHHRYLLGLLWEELTSTERFLARIDARIQELTRPFGAEIERLREIPGLDRRTAEVLLAEVGTNMKVFPSAQHLASWAGMCPGNDQTAGKRRSGRTTKGSVWLRTALVQAAWGASHVKRSYLAAQYRRLAGRRDRKRALVTVAHSLLVIVYHLLQNRTQYEDLGPDYLDRLREKHLTRYLVRRLERLGHKVTLEPLGHTA